MKAKERVLNLINRKPVDRTPCDIWLSDRANEKFCQELSVKPDNLRLLLDNHLVIVAALDNHKTWEDDASLRRAVEAGVINLEQGRKVIYDSWGVGWDTAHEGIYEVFHPIFERSALSGVRVPDLRVPHLFDPVDEAVRALGDEYCVVGCQDLTLFERACALRGFEQFLLDMKEDPAWAGGLLDVIADHEVERAAQLVARGIDLGFTGGDYGTQQSLIMSVDDWLEFEAPRLRRIWDVYKRAGVPIMHHSCGNIIALIPHLIAMGVDVLNPIQHVMDPAILRRDFGEHLVFFGGGRFAGSHAGGSARRSPGGGLAVY